MDYKYIEQLLERYWNCETSLQEESILRNFFAQNDVPAHLKPYQSLFRCQEEMANEHISEDFDERILGVLKEEEENINKTTLRVSSVKARPLGFGFGIRPFFKAAAVVAVVLSISMAVQQAMDQGQSTNVVTLPPAVVPAAPETAFDGNEAKPMVDSLKVQDKELRMQGQTVAE